MDTLRVLWHRISDWLHALLAWVEGFAATPYGGTALFVFAFAESSFFPIPPDVLLIPLCLGDPSKAFWFAFLCSAGSVLGGIAGYGIGYWGGRPLVYKLFPDERVRRVERLYERWNAWATGIAGLTPLPYKIFTLSGGACAIGFKVFVLASIVSRSLRFFAVATLLYFFGEPIRDFIEEYLNVLSILFVVFLVGGFWLIGRVGGRAAGDGDGEGGGEGSAPEVAP
jgi:membrane protein YqaA with SNARE-associated domain